MGITARVSDDEILEEQEGKGYGDDEGERDDLLDPDVERAEEPADE